MVALTTFVAISFLGFALAIPTPTPTYPIIGPSCSCPNTPYSFFSSIYSAEFSYDYYSAGYCASVGYDVIADYIPKILYDDIDRMILQAKCEWLNSFSTYYPRNIASSIYDMSDELLTYDYVILEGSAGSLSSIQYLIEQGFRVLVLDEGLFPPAIASSLYYRHSLLNSPFVKPYDAYIPGCGCNIPKRCYMPKVLGGSSIIDFNGWDYGCRSVYDNLAQLSDIFSWDNAYSRYQKIERIEQTTTVSKQTNVQVGPCGCVRISTSVKETSVTRRISNVFKEIGYGNGFSPLTIDHTPGLCTVPYIGSPDSPLLYPQEIFSRLSCFDNIDLILGLRIERLLFDSCGRVIGVEIITQYGPKKIIPRYDVIMGGSSISMFELLTRSGVGNPSYLNKFGIPIVRELPYLGQRIMANPIYFNTFVRLPRGTLIDECDGDYTSFDFMFGQSSMNSISNLFYHSAFINVRNSVSSNVMIRFYAFTRSMRYRMQMTLSYYFQLDFKMVEYIMNMCEEWDLLFMVPQLLTPTSYGCLEYGETIEDLRINLGMYQQEEDILCMLEAVRFIERIGRTSIFSTLGGQLMQLPYESITAEFFSEEFIRQSLPYFSIPSFNMVGGGIMGTDITSSVVDTNFYFHGIPNLLCLSPAISPYAIGSDSIAFSSLLGTYGSEFMINRYNSGYSTSMSTSSSSFISNTGGIGGIGGVGGIGGIGGVGISETELYERELVTSGGSLIGGSTLNTGLNGGIVSSNGMISEYAASEAEASSFSTDIVNNSNGFYNSQSIDTSYAASNAESASTMLTANGLTTEYAAAGAEAASFSSDIVTSNNGMTTMSSIDSSYAAAESESMSTTLLGGGGVISEYEASESEAYSSSIQSTSMGCGGLQSMSSSTCESTTSYENSVVIDACGC